MLRRSRARILAPVLPEQVIRWCLSFCGVTAWPEIRDWLLTLQFASGR